MRLHFNEDENEDYMPIEEDAKQLLIVSQLEFKEGNKFDVLVEPATGSTCARCWMIVPVCNEDELCPRCASIIANKK